MRGSDDLVNLAGNDSSGLGFLLAVTLSVQGLEFRKQSWEQAEWMDGVLEPLGSLALKSLCHQQSEPAPNI